MCTNARIPDKQLKFLVPRDMTVAEFQMVLRQKIELKPTEAIFLFIGKHIPAGSVNFHEIDCRFNDKDTDMVHVQFSGENTFGSFLRSHQSGEVHLIGTSSAHGHV